MAIRISFDINHNPIPPTFVLANRNGNKLGVITNVYAINMSDAMNDIPTITFSVSKRDNFTITNIWDSIADLKLVWCKEWDYWFEMSVELDDADETVKNVECRALCQSELSQVNLYNIQINTESDIARENYTIPTTIYDPEHPEASLLNRISEKIPHYKIKHVDSTISKLQRTFEFNGTSIMDALNSIAEEINCLIVYGNGSTEDLDEQLGRIPERTISLYDLETTCKSCGHRGEFSDVCPNCGSNELDYGYGKDTTIFISKDNLTDNVTFSTDLDSVKNCFHLVGGDDLMTATIRSCNPNGSGYMWYITPETMSDMPEELISKLIGYQTDHEYYSKEYRCNVDEKKISQYNSLITKYSGYNVNLQVVAIPIIGYANLMNILYDTIDFWGYLNDSMMPTPQINKTSAADQVKLLTASNLSPCAVSNYSSISATTVDSNILSIAKIFIRPNYKIEIENSSFDKGKSRWTGNFTVTSYSDEEDTATSPTITVVITDDYEQYVKQLLDKALKNSENDDYDITSLFKKDYYSFVNDLKKYGLASLKEFHECCQTCIDVLIEQGVADSGTWGNVSDDLYSKFYLNYVNKLNAIESEITVRESEIGIIDELVDSIENERNWIQSQLDFQSYLGDTLWKQFCAYRREDEYSNSNYISDGLTNGELFRKAGEFLEQAEKEIYKSANLQHHISTTLRNLLVIKEFEKILDYFEVGNWLRIEVDGNIYKLRLTQYQIDFDNLETISVEFSDVLKVLDGRSDTNSIIDKLNSMASSYTSVEHQASKGEESSKYIASWHKEGLDATLTRIVNNADRIDIVWDSHGMLFRRYDDVIEDYLPKQMKIINSTLVVTDDNWESVKTALGLFYYYDVLTGELKEGYGINGEVVVGKLILGEELGIYNDAASMRFTKDGLSIYNDVNYFIVNPNDEKLVCLSRKIPFGDGFDFQDMLWVDNNGMLHITGDGAGLDISANSTVNNLYAGLEVNANSITTEVNRATKAEGDLSARITVNAESITSEVTRAKKEEGNLSTRITQTSESITAEVNRATKAEGDLSSKLELLPDQITLSVSGGLGNSNASITLNVNGSKKTAGIDLGNVRKKFESDSSSITISAGTITFDSGHFILNSTNFSVASDGTITSTAGKIGEWSITGSSLYKGSSAYGASGSGNMYLGDEGISISNTFKVSKTGALTATSANISGTINASTLQAKDKIVLYNSSQSNNFSIEYDSYGILNFKVGSSSSSWQNTHTNFYGNLSIGNNLEVESSIFENGTALANKYAAKSHTHSLSSLGAAAVSHAHSNYLSVNGGTINGDLKVSQSSITITSSKSGMFNEGFLILPTGLTDVYDADNDRYVPAGGIKFGNGAMIYSEGNQSLRLYASQEKDYALLLEVAMISPYPTKTWTFRPSSDSSVKLGLPNCKWNLIYSASGTIQTSDRTQKNTILPISKPYEETFSKLRPVTYKFNNGNRTHTGFISQEVYDAMKESGLTDMDWAAFCRDLKEGSDDEYIYGLRPDEIIPLNTHMIQKLMKEVCELKEKIAELKSMKIAS